MPLRIILGLAFLSLYCATQAAELPPLLLQGETRTVHIRRDAMGAAATIQVGKAMNASIISGKVVQVNGDWIVLETATGKAWVPLRAVLYVE